MIVFAQDFLVLARKAQKFAQGVYIDVHDRSEKRSLTQHTARYLALNVGV